jgi:phosphoglycerate-specific signal transduction histidine kinase
MRKMISNLKMQKKLLLPPLTVLVFLVIFGIISFIGMASQRSTINEIYTNRFQGYQTISTIVNDMKEVHSNTYKVLSWSSADFLRQNVEKLSKHVFKTIEKRALSWRRPGHRESCRKRRRNLHLVRNVAEGIQGIRRQGHRYVRQRFQPRYDTDVPGGQEIRRTQQKPPGTSCPGEQTRP